MLLGGVMKTNLVNKQLGFTLIEVLLAVVILGIGLLGIVTLQGRSLQYNQQAYLYSQASFLANDIAERMRANSQVINQYEIDFNDEASGATATQCLTANCSESQFANWDLKVWKDSLKSALPSGDGSIVANGDDYKIIVQFDDSRGQDSLHQITITVQL